MAKKLLTEQLLSNRTAIFENRINLGWKGLLEDIERWQNALQEDSDIKHHVTQFEEFSKRAHGVLMSAYKQGGWQSQEKQIMFEALVTAALTSQWLILRQAAQQRLQGSPYNEMLDKFDKQAAQNYQRLRQVLPDDLQAKLPKSPPIIYMGPISELAIFSQPEAPTIISLPLGAGTTEDNKSEYALFHEAAHSVFSQLPSFMKELERKVRDKFHFEGQLGVIYEAIFGWLDEMVVDMGGTTLGGGKFGESAIWLTTSIDNAIGTARDSEHPPGLIRPYVHLETLDYLKKGITEVEADAKQLKEIINKVVGTRLNRRFESISALTVVSMKSIRDEMIKVVRFILEECKLDVFEGKTLGEILVLSAQYKLQNIEPIREPWGEIEIAPTETQKFMLKLPTVQLEHLTPGRVINAICCFMGVQSCCLAT